jgi:hypothetical protein
VTVDSRLGDATSFPSPPALGDCFGVESRSRVDRLMRVCGFLFSSASAFSLSFSSARRAEDDALGRERSESEQAKGESSYLTRIHSLHVHVLTSTNTVYNL